MPDQFPHNFDSITGEIALDTQPKVHIEYSVMKGPNAHIKKHIPFVMGILAPLRGDREREAGETPAFVEISKESFNEEMKRFKPTANVEVDNVLAGDGSKLQLNLTFESIEDFSPAAVARKVDSLRHILEMRTYFKQLRTKTSGRQELITWLSKLLKDDKTLAPLKEKLAALAKQSAPVAQKEGQPQ